jgi:hypothetical protein
MKGTGEFVLYLDFDGVLHHENCLWHPTRGAYLAAPARYTLFQHAELLAAELEPFPEVRIVLSTSWVLRYGFSRAASRLPDALGSRCIGATFHARAMHEPTFCLTPRGEQVLDDVARRRPSGWVALDDCYEGWPDGAPWIQTDPYEGISGAGVLGKLQEALLQQFS